MKYKRYNDFSEIKQNDEVKLSTNDEWDELYGVIEEVNNVRKMAVIFCSSKPEYRYLVFEWNMNCIEMIEH